MNLQGVLLRIKFLINILTILIIFFLLSQTVKAQWVQLSNQQFTSVKSIINFENNLFALTDNQGIYYSNNKGDSWIYRGLSGLWATCMATDGKNLFVAVDDTVYFSSDIGITWTKNKSGLYINDFFINDSIIYAATSFGVFQSTDETKSWKQIMSTSPFGYGISPINAVCSKDSIMVAGFYDGVCLSSDKGLNWKFIGGGLRHVSSFLFVGTKIFAGHAQGVYVSIDNGHVWGARNNGLCFPANNQNGFAFTVRTMIKKDDKIFAGTLGGVFLSTDEGNNWRNINSGFPFLYFESHYSQSFPDIISLAVDNEYIYAVGVIYHPSYFEHCIWRCQIDKMITSVSKFNELPSVFSLNQNYPNPFNSSSIISYSIPTSSHVILDVYDILGRRIETLVNENKAPGNYTVEFNGNKFSSGIYYYRIITKDFIETKKLILLK